MSESRNVKGTLVEGRDWVEFHPPTNLAMALSVELAEIVEHFQWLTDEKSSQGPLRDPQRDPLALSTFFEDAKTSSTAA